MIFEYWLYCQLWHFLYTADRVCKRWRRLFYVQPWWKKVCQDKGLLQQQTRIPEVDKVVKQIQLLFGEYVDTSFSSLTVAKYLRLGYCSTAHFNTEQISVRNKQQKVTRFGAMTTFILCHVRLKGLFDWSMLNSTRYVDLG